MGLDAKADKLLTERRVRVIRSGRDSIAAVVRGDHAIYLVKLDFDAQRRRLNTACDCASWKTKCSHVRAVLKVWRPPEEGKSE